MAYMHINQLYKDQRILLFKECYAMEKIHGCVQRGTLVTMADGTKRPIETIRSGDRVVAYNEGVAALESAVVDALVVQSPDMRLPWCRVTLADGRAVVCTEDHPFMTTVGWIPAGELTDRHNVLTC